MINTYALGIVVRVAAFAVLAALGYCLVNYLQHLQFLEIYKVAGTF